MRVHVYCGRGTTARSGSYWCRALRCSFNRKVVEELISYCDPAEAHEGILDVKFHVPKANQSVPETLRDIGPPKLPTPITQMSQRAGRQRNWSGRNFRKVA